MKETELKKLFQKKFAKREVPYNAASWEKLSLLLDKAAIPWYAKSGVWLKVTGSLAAVSMAGLIYVYSVDQEASLLLESQSNSKMEIQAQEDQSPNLNSPTEGNNLPQISSTQDGLETESQSTSPSVSKESNTLPSARTEMHSGSGANTLFTSKQKNGNTQSQLSRFSSDRSTANVNEEALVPLIINARELPDLSAAQNSLSSPKPLLDKTTFAKRRWKPNTRWSFGLHALIGMSSSLGNAADQSSNINAFGLGLSAKYYFASIWTIEANLNYMRRSGMQMNREILGRSFGFGSEQEIFAVETQAMDFLEFPIFLGIRIAPNHRMKAGYYFAPILNIHNEVIHSFKPMNSDTWQHTTESQSGYSEAFEKVDHGWAFGYEWTPNARFGIGLDYFHGLSDLSINAHFNENHVDLNRQVKLRLAYYFF